MVCDCASGTDLLLPNVLISLLVNACNMAVLFHKGGPIQALISTDEQH